MVAILFDYKVSVDAVSACRRLIVEVRQELLLDVLDEGQSPARAPLTQNFEDIYVNHRKRVLG